MRRVSFLRAYKGQAREHRRYRGSDETLSRPMAAVGIKRPKRAIASHNYAQIFFSFIGSFLGIGALAYLTAQSGYPLIAAPFGATAVLVFGVPDSPLAQPRNVVCGNFIGALTCATLVHFLGHDPWVMALAVATAIKLMQLTHTVHPPAGAVALLGVMNDVSWDFVLMPVLLGSVLIVSCTVLFNNLVPDRPYPQKWF
jgi:CBS-domain-containing membrane protein